MTEKTFVNKLENILIKEGYFSRREVGVGYGIADLVIVKQNSFNIDNCKKRRGYGQFSKLLSEEYFKVLEQLPDFEKKVSNVDLNFLIEKTSLSKNYLKYTILKDLQNKRFIKITSEGTYFKVNGWVPIVKEVIAIEAKLKDWKRGFIQANRYKAFADKAYLAIPKGVEHLVNKSLLKKHGIGLMVLDTTSNMKKIIIPAKKEKPLNLCKRNFAIEYFWSNKYLKQVA